MPWASNDGGEDGPGGIISSESGLAHAGSIVHNQSSNVLVTHVDLGFVLVGAMKLRETFSGRQMKKIC